MLAHCISINKKLLKCEIECEKNSTVEQAQQEACGPQKRTPFPLSPHPSGQHTFRPFCLSTFEERTHPVRKARYVSSIVRTYRLHHLRTFSGTDSTVFVSQVRRVVTIYLGLHQIYLLETDLGARAVARGCLKLIIVAPQPASGPLRRFPESFHSPSSRLPGQQ